MKKEKIAIICPVKFPVPAVKGGAIETLIEEFLNENEKGKLCDIVLYSYYNEEAMKLSKNYKETQFVYYKINKWVNKFNNLLIKILRKVFKKEINTIFMRKVLKDLEKKKITKVIIEGNNDLVLPIKQYNNSIEIYSHIHHDAFDKINAKNKEVIKSCKKIISVSEYIKKETISRFKDCKNIEVLHNCTDVELFNKSKYINERGSLREKYKIEDDEIVILFSGRILEIKGVKELILAFKKILVTEKVKLMIVGNAGFAETVTSKYDKELLEISKDIKDKIIFTGFIHNKELPKLHVLADIAVVPSIWNEPAGLVVIEAMASSLPLVVTNSGGIPEYINEECAMIIDIDDNIVDNLAKTLEILVKDKEKRQSMGAEGRKYVLNFDATTYYNNFVKILKQ